MTRILLAFCCILSVSMAGAQPMVMTIFKDNFDDNRFGWMSEKRDSSEQEVTNGKYFFVYKGSRGWLYTRYIPLEKSLPTSVTAAFTLYAGDDSKAYGMVLNYKDASNYIEFNLSGNGFYRINSYVKDKPTNQVSKGWKKHDLVKKGFGQVNVLRVDIQRGQYSFYLNGTLMDSANLSAQPETNRIGFVNWGKQQVLIDDFEVKQWSNDNVLPGKITGGRSSFTGTVAPKPTPFKTPGLRTFYYLSGQQKMIGDVGLPDGKNGVVDKDGYRVVDPVYAYITEFKNGRSSVMIADSIGYALIDDKLTMLTPFAFRFPFSFDNGYAVEKMGLMYGLLNAEGKIVLPFIYDNLSTPENGILYAKLNGKDGIISIAGAEVIPFGKIKVSGAPKIRNGLFPAYDDKMSLMGIMDKQGNWLVQPQYKNINLNEDGSYTVSLKHPGRNLMTLQGVLGKDGKIIVQPIYGMVQVTKENIILGNEESGSDISFKSPKMRYALADKTGKLITEMKYLRITASSQDPDYYTAVAELKTDPANRFGKVGVLDKKGKEVVACNYDSKSSADGFSFGANVSNYKEGLINVWKDGKFGFVDHTGKTILPFEFTSADAFMGGYAKVSKEGTELYIDKAGKKIEDTEARTGTTILPPVR